MRVFARYFTVCLMLALVAMPLAARAKIDEASKYKLHAVFLYNFISGVEWPRLMYSDNLKNIDLCIIGEDKLGNVIDAVAAKAVSKGVQINIKRNITPEAAEHCNIVYVSDSADAAALVAKLQNKPVLTVSESAGFAKSGGVIEFTLQGTNVRFMINNHVAKQHDLKINPQLLEAAVEVIN